MKWKSSSLPELFAMKLALNLTRFALLALVSASIGTWGLRTFTSVLAAEPGVEAPDDGIVVLNFHAAIRCDACREIGTEAQALLETDYRDELKTGRMQWRSVNYEAPANKHFVRDYDLTTSTIVVTRREGGRDVEWQRLDDVWEHVFDGPAMRAYLKKQIDPVRTP